MNLNSPTDSSKDTLTPGALTPPDYAGTVLLDPGLYGTLGWLDTDPESPFSAVNLFFAGVTGDGVGEDMMRTADSAISCQFRDPGSQPAYPQPVGSTYCEAHPASCTAGTRQGCCPAACGCPGTQTCGENGTWGACVGAAPHGVKCQ